MATMLKAVCECLNNDGLVYEVSDDETQVRFRMQTDLFTWACLMYVEPHRLLVVSTLPISVAPERRSAVAELISRINCTLFIGGLDLDFDSGEVRTRSALDVATVNPSAELVRPVIHANLATTSSHARTIEQVATTEVSPVAALAQHN